MARGKVKRFLIFGTALLILAAAGYAVFAFLLPHNKITIANAKVGSTTTTNGIKQVNATLDVNCNATEANGFVNCQQAQVTGDYSNKQSSVAISGEADNKSASNGHISLAAKKISFKSVVIRPEPIKGKQSSQYKLTMQNKDKKDVLIYNLTVNTNFTESDLKLINKAPTAEGIQSTLKKISTMGNVCIVNEDNDVNNMLGKAGSYYIAVYFADTRLPVTQIFDDKTNTERAPKDACEAGTDGGGSIEVYKTTDDANKRKRYLDGFSGSLLDSGTAKVVDTTVIRISSQLKASQQKDLQQQVVQALTT